MTLDLSLLPDGGVGWLDAAGDHSDIVLSTRIRLARNVEGYAFTPRARDGERLRVLSQVREAAQHSQPLSQSVLLRVDELPQLDRQLLHERHLVSKELAGFDGPHGVRTGAAVLLGDEVSVMVNEEDHLRLQALRSGFELPAAWRAVERLDQDLGGRVPYAFHGEFGFLTACPNNTGTGMRASVLIHLTGLVLTKEIQKVLAGLQQIGLTYRGLYGEGSEVVGNFFQISNQTTLGKTEEDLIDHLQRIVQQVVQYESSARAVLTRDAPLVIEDKVWRAYGLLRHARSASFEELMNLLSGVRLGVGLKLIPRVSVHTLNRIMIFAQAAHLDRVADQALPKGDPDVRRAAYVRGVLAAEEPGASHA